MTAPRKILAGETYLLTRRCSERRYFLRPDEETKAVFEYCLGEAAERFGIHVIQWTAMSNHYHAVVEDQHGVLPEFLCHFHKMTARLMNLLLGRSEAFWAAEPASVVRLVEPQDVLDKSIYTVVNPVAEHLVERVEDWPGASGFAAVDGRSIRVERPRGFFREDGPMPAEVAVRAKAPSGWPGGAEAWAEALRRGARAHEEAAKRDRAATGRKVAGRRAVQRTPIGTKPVTPEASHALHPHLACADPARRTVELEALWSFRKAYWKARELFIRGLEAVFPHGTYKLVRELGAPCHPAPV